MGAGLELLEAQLAAAHAEARQREATWQARMARDIAAHGAAFAEMEEAFRLESQRLQGKVAQLEVNGSPSSAAAAAAAAALLLLLLLLPLLLLLLLLLLLPPPPPPLQRQGGKDGRQVDMRVRRGGRRRWPSALLRRATARWARSGGRVSARWCRQP